MVAVVAKHQTAPYHILICHISNFHHHLIAADSVVAGAIGSVPGVMKDTNDQMKPEQIAGLFHQFEKENMKMDMKD